MDTSLRVALVLGVFFIFVVVFLFVFFLFVRLLPQEGIGGDTTIKGVGDEVFWIHSLHAQWYASPPLANDKVHTLL